MDNQKNKKVYMIGAIALLLIVAMIISVISFVNKKTDENPQDSDNVIGDTGKGTNLSTNAPTDVSTNKKTDNVQQVIFPKFYIKGNLGYVTKDNVTTFFVVANQFQTKSPFKFEDPMSGCYNTLVDVIINFTPDIYNNGEYYPYISTDCGDTWKELTYNDYYNGYIETYVNSSEFYIAYTQVENCTQPIYYLEQIQNYSFKEATTKECLGCCGTYTSYEDFPFVLNHVVGKG